jgi:aminocarboxymuconate-semialdehyde decarboxylase
MAAMQGAVDVHAHFVAPGLVAEVAAGRAPGVAWDGERLVFAGRARTRPVLRALFDLEERRRWMASQGVTRQLVAAEPEMYGYELPPEQGARWCVLLNDAAAADLWGAEDLVPLAHVPLQDGRLAAAELRRAVLSCRCRGSMVHSRLAGGFDDPSLDPFWAASCELDVPVVVHPSNPDGDARLGRYYLANAVGRPFETAVVAAHLLCGGVFDRFPDLRVLLAHGGGHLPFQLHRLDRARQAHPEGWIGRRPPSAYFGRLYFDTILFDPEPLRWLIRRAGASQVCLGSDWPFSMADPEPAATVRSLGLPPADEQAVSAGNARRIFGL